MKPRGGDGLPGRRASARGGDLAVVGTRVLPTSRDLECSTGFLGEAKLWSEALVPYPDPRCYCYKRELWNM